LVLATRQGFGRYLGHLLKGGKVRRSLAGPRGLTALASLYA
jgi:hypothetical protein